MAFDELEKEVGREDLHYDDLVAHRQTVVGFQESTVEHGKSHQLDLVGTEPLELVPGRRGLLRIVEPGMPALDNAGPTRRAPGEGGGPRHTTDRQLSAVLPGEECLRWDLPGSVTDHVCARHPAEQLGTLALREPGVHGKDQRTELPCGD